MMLVFNLQVYKALKNDVIPVAAKLLAADGDQDAFAQEVRTGSPCTPAWLCEQLSRCSRIRQIMLGDTMWQRASPSLVPLGKASTDLQVSILESCRDRNIVQFIGAVSDGQQTMLVTE